MNLMEIMTALGNTASGRRLVEEARKMASDARATKHAELVRAQKEGEARLLPLQRAEAAATSKCESAAAALLSAQAGLREAYEARAAAAHQKDRREVLIEAELITLAPPEISRFEDYLAEVRAAIGAMPEPWGLHRDARVRAFGLAQAARDRAEELRRSGLSDAAIIAELQRLRGDIEKAAKGMDRGFPRAVAAVRRFEIGPEAAA